jgi:hypothetical protein
MPHAPVVAGKSTKGVVADKGEALMNSKKSKPKPDDKEQSARFIETARQIESDNPKEAFEEALDKIVKKNKNSKVNS